MKIIFIEDVASWVESLEFSISPYLTKQKVELKIKTLPDGSMVLQELMANDIDYIFIDYDLGGSYGEDVIEDISLSPDFDRIPIIFYSGGLSVVELKTKSSRYGNVKCLTKNDVRDFLIRLTQ